MKRTLTALLISAGLLFAVAAPAQACSCPPVSEQEKFDSATAVFTGRALDEQDVDTDPDNWQKGYYATRFAVTEKRKGAVGDLTTVFTQRTESLCGWRFVVGHRYEVYAFAEEKGLHTNSCSVIPLGA
ncbi:hypothetical protein D5S17_23825 [Pseudonocardiaceae bacterium YIM PH 21723]|nr:hypothetical protein D5S17_23825 [Pseudonocardiaceae bacterium YIM PH 21723]